MTQLSRAWNVVVVVIGLALGAVTLWVVALASQVVSASEGDE